MIQKMKPKRTLKNQIEFDIQVGVEFKRKPMIQNTFYLKKVVTVKKRILCWREKGKEIFGGEENDKRPPINQP